MSCSLSIKVAGTITAPSFASAVVLAEGFVGSDELTRELQTWVKHQTAPYKYPRIIEYVDALPKTVNGKIRRVAIRQKDGADTASPKLPEGLL